MTRAEGAAFAHHWTESPDPMNAACVLAIVIFAFGGIAAALAWSEAQNRAPSK
jgi:hypothetical protein